MMSKNCNNERMAMILQYVAIGSMIIMAGAAASQVLREAFASPNHDRGRGWSRVRQACLNPRPRSQAKRVEPERSKLLV